MKLLAGMCSETPVLDERDFVKRVKDGEMSIFTMNLESKTFAELSRVNLHRGIFDQMFNVGDVQITTNQFTKKNMPALININSISNYTEVYQMVKKLQKDIYSDIMYPNDLRPKENHGYKTKYRG